MSPDRVNYPSWALVGPREFVAFRHEVLVGTQTYIIPFALLGFPLGLAMIWLRHPAISRWLIVLALAIGVLGAITTAQLTIPLQKQMLLGDPANIPMLVGKLIDVDRYWRIIPGLLAMVAYGICCSSSPLSRPSMVLAGDNFCGSAPCGGRSGCVVPKLA